MDDYPIRSISADELPAFEEVLALAFHEGGIDEHLQDDQLIAEPDRWFAATDDGRMVGTAGACTTWLTVPGPRSLQAPGVTAVSVLPSHRRRGINTRLMGTLLDQASERGEPLAYLWASESSIYGRFGYGIASFCAELEVPTERSEFVDGVEIVGRVRALPREQALPLMRPVYEVAAAARPGMIAIDDRWWTVLSRPRKKDEDEPVFFAVHEDPGGVPDGYATYRVKHEWPHGVASNQLTVESLIAASPAATAALWRHLLDIDLVATVKAWGRPADEEILSLVREPRRLKFTVSDGLWVRLIDIPDSLTGRSYSSDGRLVVDVRDAFRPRTSGRYELVVEGGEGKCATTDSEPDLACGVAVLGAVYLGGSSFRRLARIGQVRELTDNALARADSMFAWDPSPWFGFIF
jgi:predicted acetyltransferase